MFLLIKAHCVQVSHIQCSLLLHYILSNLKMITIMFVLNGDVVSGSAVLLNIHGVLK
jgi:hypothetical protein